MSGITKQTINTATNGGGQKVKSSKLSTSLNGKKRRAVMVPADAAGGNKIVIKTRNGINCTQPAPVSTTTTNNNVVTTTCTVMNSGSSLLRDA